MSEYHCTNCGKTGYGSAGSGPMSGSNPPSGWKTKWGSTKMFCSSRCKDEYDNRNSSSSSSSSSQNSSSSSSDNERPKTAEEIRAEHEVAMEKRRIYKEEEAQNAAIRKLKAQKYKDKGQHFIAWLVQMNPLYKFLFLWPLFFLAAPGGLKIIGIIFILGFILLLIKDLTKMSWKIFSIGSAVVILSMVGYAKYTSGANERSRQANIERNAELEKIETEVILGINSGENKKKLLDLVSQLQCEVGDDDEPAFVEGKKNGIIKTGDASTDGPDDEFTGTYSEYWAAKREAYTEIIMSGVKVDAYIEKIRKEKKGKNSIVTNDVTKSDVIKVDSTEVQNNEDSGFVQNEPEPESRATCDSDKAYFYKEPDLSTIKKAFVVRDQEITYGGDNGDFVYATYTNERGIKTVGWLLKSDLNY